MSNSITANVEANTKAVVKAAQAFVEWHRRGQAKPRTPDSFYPMTYAQQDAWLSEWDNRLETLIWAVSVLSAEVPGA